MDPFTAKLLERTRARRENLQKKMADASNRQMGKRVREPLTDTNSGLKEPADKASQMSSKPSPSKRKCSGENVQPACGEENLEPPPAVPSYHPLQPDPATYQAENTQPSVSVQPKTMAATAAPDHLSTSNVGFANPVTVDPPAAEELKGNSASSVQCMKSRLQRLAEQRKCWDGIDDPDEVPDDAPLSLLKRQPDVPPAPPATNVPVGRRGRLANLAATIGSWEDDLSHANTPRENAKGNSATSSCSINNAGPRSKPAATTDHKSTNKVDSAAKSNKVTLPRPQQTCDTLGTSHEALPSPQKNTDHRTACVSTPPKTKLQTAVCSPGPSLSTHLRKSPMAKVVSSNVPMNSPTLTSEICKRATSAQKSVMLDAPVKSPVVKSVLERFGECYVEHVSQSSSAAGALQAKSSTPSAAPNSRLVQDRLKAIQGTQTHTADLTQQQKMQRESELAQIRSRFQKGCNNSAWGEKDKTDCTRKVKDNKDELPLPVLEPNTALSDPKNEYMATPISKEKTRSQTAQGGGLALSPPVMKSSPKPAVAGLKRGHDGDHHDEVEDVVREIEMNVDQSINSAVISEIFNVALEQSENQDTDEDEEEPLNISSMSLLAPLAETVAAVVRSPEGRMTTSTPTSSFIVKTMTPDFVLKDKSQLASELLSHSSDSSNVVADELPYSIDAYRSIRMKETERPPVSQKKEEFSLRAEELKATSGFCIKQKIKLLTNEINLQQTIIHQASQALNCCTDEEHGKGSQVEAEAERVLLVATERRVALKKELDRLKVEGPSNQKKISPAPGDTGIAASMGSITLQELRLPLKADFVCSMANKPEATKYSFFIMIRAGPENTVATPLASTHRGLSGDTLTFPTKFTISDVTSDFAINVEVYSLVQKREVFSDKKKKPYKSKAITPKRFLAITKSGSTPVVASPGGPHAVRTSNFVLVGSHKLTLSSIGITKFPLDKVPFMCPLDGSISLKLQCKVGSKIEERGFLTMFEDVSGFGAWHRRWCVLSGYCISYWTYPDDEKRKNPIGRINLANCTSKIVEPAKREFCARPHTFELITVRPKKEDDKETLVSQCENTTCVTKNWLSADTKDERNLWMKKLNQILVDLRMWQPDSCQLPL
ncbi:anillin isoform X1 [Synchiropus splendidus]|uniref:anillin isoform X1 n=1 Tax=Synchiropus splendidus TaxID=270530 RepID=UPI00237E88B7|nr:anillin isoform X1 [Synchiropus splendidus]